MRFQGIYVFQLAQNGGQLAITAMELFIVILIFFFLEYSCFTMMCDFLLYSQVNQLYVYICPLIWISFPFESPQSTVETSLCYPEGSHWLSM